MVQVMASRLPLFDAAVPARARGYATPVRAAAGAAALRSVDDDSERRGIFLVECGDRSGIIRSVSDAIEQRGGTIRHIDLHVERGTFWGRIEFAYDPTDWPSREVRSDFLQESGVVGLLPEVRNPKLILTDALGTPERLIPVAVMASKQDHCLVDFLYRWQSGELPVDLKCVVSNHPVPARSHVARFLDRHGVPLHILPAHSPRSNEPDVLRKVAGTELLVLARYMQVLSANFLDEYGHDIINIHHGLLPSFKGAAPYRQAYTAGVKIIGATAHFVTENLDEGPIIRQLVESVTHRDSLATLARKSKSLEQRCLADAVRMYVEGRVIKGPRGVIVLE